MIIQKMSKKYFEAIYVEPYQKFEVSMINLNFKMNEEQKKGLEKWRNMCVEKTGDQLSHLSTQFQLFNITQEMKEVFIHTDNEIFYRKPPFPYVMLNTDFWVGKERVQGISIMDWDTLAENNKHIAEYLKNNFLITFITYPNDQLCALHEEDTSQVNAYQGSISTFQKGLTEGIEGKEELVKQVMIFVLNFLDFLHEPDIELITTQREPSQDAKRLKRGKNPKLATTMIRITGKMKLYFDSITTTLKTPPSHRYWTRGHWRHFKSRYYKKMFGQKEWIKPFIKGRGELIKKSYEIT